MSTRKVQKFNASKMMALYYFLRICILNKRNVEQTNLSKLFSTPNRKVIELVTRLTF